MRRSRSWSRLAPRVQATLAQRGYDAAAWNRTGWRGPHNAPLIAWAKSRPDVMQALKVEGLGVDAAAILDAHRAFSAPGVIVQAQVHQQHSTWWVTIERDVNGTMMVQSVHFGWNHHAAWNAVRWLKGHGVPVERLIDETDPHKHGR